MLDMSGQTRSSKGEIGRTWREKQHVEECTSGFPSGVVLATALHAPSTSNSLSLGCIRPSGTRRKTEIEGIVCHFPSQWAI